MAKPLFVGSILYTEVGDAVTPPPPTAPTVTTLATASATPTITGTFDSLDYTGFVVYLNGASYTLGVDAALTSVVNAWTLVVPVGSELVTGVYDVMAVATNANGSTADTTINEVTVTLPISTVVCPTFRTVMNKILINIQETTIASTATAISSDYHYLVRNMLNTLLREIQDAHDWTSLRTDCYATITAGATYGYINDGTANIPAGARLVRLPDPRHGAYVASVYDVTDTSSPSRVIETDLQLVLQNQNLFTDQAEQPREFALDTYANTTIVRFNGLPSVDRDIELGLYIPQPEFAGTASDIDSCIKLPQNAVKALELGVTWYALEERGEELGPNSMFTQARYEQALNAAIAQNEVNGSGDNHTMVPV